jgi:broad-specificity NMP kinase
MAEIGHANNAKQKLIIITGSPCVGKTTVADSLFESYENAAYFDGDWAWRVNPFSISDPRLRNGDKTMSFALSTYLNSSFDYVIFSSVVVIGEEIRKAIINDITAKNYTTIAFTLKCSEETLVERHKNRGDTTEVSFYWLNMEPHHGDYIINTDNKSVTDIVKEMKQIIDNTEDDSYGGTI